MFAVQSIFMGDTNSSVVRHVSGESETVFFLIYFILFGQLIDLVLITHKYYFIFLYLTKYFFR